VRILNATKKHALSQGKLLCIGDVTTLNVTRGCAGQCAFCFARCYPGAPPAGRLLLYHELAGQLRHELDTTRRRRPLPDFVIIGSAGDPFLGGPPVLQLTHACIEVLLQRDIGISLATRGMIPDPTIDLLARHAPRVRIAISITSLDLEYTHRWEPGAEPPERRLFLVDKLRRAGIDPEVRIEPVIPHVNDSSDGIRTLASALLSVGQQHAVLGFIQLRRGLVEQLRREAPHEALRLVLGAFPSQQDTGHPADFDHLEQRQAIAALLRLQATASERGLRLSACRCHSPGLPASSCAVAPADRHPPALQPSLFASTTRDDPGQQ
jgi:DNA repair photolyase